MKGLRIYTKNIEAEIIAELRKAKKSVTIAMAWLTSNPIKNTLLEISIVNPHLIISLVVDQNSINARYFLDYEDAFLKTGIRISSSVSRRFLHLKFTVIDNAYTIVGSYNFTAKARSNIESIYGIKNRIFADYHTRIFRCITEEEYIDPNVLLLLNYPEFARLILSTYYPFTLQQYKKYKTKLLLGQCFTHFNGLYDELTYYPGIIFNMGLKFDIGNSGQEFPIPVSKSMIVKWHVDQNADWILEGFRGHEESYHLINGELNKSENATNRRFTAAVEATHSTNVLKSIMENGIDIIKEDFLWSQNFSNFMNKDILQSIFNKISEINELP